MPSPEQEEKKELKENIQRRLRRIEGQVRGLQRIINEDACCMDIIIQIAAIRAAVSKVGILIFENHIQKCLAQALEGENIDREQALNELVSVLNNFIK